MHARCPCCSLQQCGTTTATRELRLARPGRRATRASIPPAAAARADSDRQQPPADRACRAPPHQQLLGAAAVAASLSAAAAAGAVDQQAEAAAAAAKAAAAAAAAGGYVPSPVELGWEIWVGFIAGVVPFLIASWEFGKRILIQRRCPACRGKGLVQRGRYLRKCSECGGLLPWMGWRYFLLGTADPGNGGFLLQPRGQKSIFYTVPPPLPREEPQPKQQQQQQAAGQQALREEAQQEAAAAAAEEKGQP